MSNLILFAVFLRIATLILTLLLHFLCWSHLFPNQKCLNRWRGGSQVWFAALPVEVRHFKMATDLALMFALSFHLWHISFLILSLNTTQPIQSGNIFMCKSNVQNPPNYHKPHCNLAVWFNNLHYKEVAIYVYLFILIYLTRKIPLRHRVIFCKGDLAKYVAAINTTLFFKHICRLQR